MISVLTSVLTTATTTRRWVRQQHWVTLVWFCPSLHLSQACSQHQTEHGEHCCSSLTSDEPCMPLTGCLKAVHYKLLRLFFLKGSMHLIVLFKHVVVMNCCYVSVIWHMLFPPASFYDDEVVCLFLGTDRNKLSPPLCFGFCLAGLLFWSYHCWVGARSKLLRIVGVWFFTDWVPFNCLTNSIRTLKTTFVWYWIIFTARQHSLLCRALY